MATVQFTLRDPSAKEKTSIIAFLFFGQVKIKTSTGKTIDPAEWDKKNRKAKETQRYKANETLNFDLETIREKIITAFEDHIKRNGTVYITELKTEIKNTIHPKPSIRPERITLLAAIKEYIDTVNRAPRTKLSYGTTLNTLNRYNTAEFSGKLDFNNIGMDFYNSFQRYCFQKEKLALNTFGGYIKNIKVFMDYAIDKGYTTNTGHRHKNFQRSQETADSIYLNETEISELFNLDLSENPKLDRVRDVFIISCRTGLRYSDLAELNENNITENGTRLSVRTVKTGERVEIPLHWQVKTILAKWNGTPPRAISNQKLNIYLKEIGQLEALKGMKSKVSKTITRAGMAATTNPEKWQLLTVHTGRRSFATNMYLANFPPISIMKITGHRTEKSFLKYIRITAEQNADVLAKNPYFAPPPLRVVNES